MGKVFLRCHQMKYYDRVDWNLPKTQDWEKVLAVLYPSLGTLGLSFPIHKKAVGWGLGYSIPKDRSSNAINYSITPCNCPGQDFPNSDLTNYIIK